MSGENPVPTVLASTTTTAAGVAILPNTGNSVLMTVLAITMIVCGAIVISSFVATKVYTRISN